MFKKVKQRITCPEYLARHGIHIKSGGRCVSPLRPEANNPTSFYCEDDFWFDHGGPMGGDVIDLAAMLEYDGDKGAAVRALARELGIRPDYETDTWRADIQNLCNRTAAYNHALAPEHYQYLAERGFNKEDVARNMIGVVTSGYLKGRLFLPYFKNGAVMYYATRALPGSAFEENKYMKASLNECASYSHIPWGLQTLNRRSDILVISEGYFDALSWEKEGYAVLSPITGNFSKSQWPEVISACHMFKKVLVIFDNDAISHAGDGFTARTAQKLFQARIPFLVSHTPDGIKDVNEYYAGGGVLQDLIDTAEDGLRYMAAQCKDPVALKDFIMSINRYTDSTTIAAALFQPVLEERYAPAVLKSIQKAAESAPSESQIADEIISNRQILYINNVGFYEWNGKVWQSIPDLLVENYADTAYGKRFTTANRVKAVKNLLKSRAICDVVFDRNPVLTFQNGTLEIETDKFRDFSQADYCSIIMDYDYDPDARCEQWEKFIDDVTHSDDWRQDVLRFIPGYVLFNDCRHQKVFILTGNGGNGKSVYLEIIQKLFGDKNVTHVEPTGLTDSFQRIRLKDSLLNIGSDINSDFSKGEIREWLLKIADGTSIQACYKGLDNIDFIPRCKLVYACNALPTAEIVNGLNRRMRFINFPCQYVDNPDPKKPTQKQRDVDIMAKLTAELPGIFNWAYEGYRMLRNVGYFIETHEQADFMKQFEQMSNPVAVFCEDKAEMFTGTVSRDDIYYWYTLWCENTGHKPMSRERFIPKFRDGMGDNIKGERRIRLNGTPARVFDF